MALVAASLAPARARAQAAVYPVGNGRPTAAEARKEMGIPSTDEVRGQVDNVGYASKPEAMAKVWALAAEPPAPLALGNLPAPGVVGLIGPHDDYVYAARVDRRIYPLVTAKTVVVVGVFHRYRRFGAHDQMVFDGYRRWRAPDGEITVSPLRDELVAALPEGRSGQGLDRPRQRAQRRGDRLLPQARAPRRRDRAGPDPGGLVRAPVDDGRRTSAPRWRR